MLASLVICFLSFAILENLQSWIFLDYLFTYIWHSINYVYIKWHALYAHIFCILCFLIFPISSLFSHFLYLFYVPYIYIVFFFASRIYILYLVFLFIYLFILTHFLCAILCLSIKRNWNRMIKFDIWLFYFTLTIGKHL